VADFRTNYLNNAVITVNQVSNLLAEDLLKAMEDCENCVLENEVVGLICPEHLYLQHLMNACGSFIHDVRTLPPVAE
jgi:hypothetical protein